MIKQSNINRISDFQKKWNKKRLFLKNDKWRKKYKKAIVNFKFPLLEDLKLMYPMCCTIGEMFPIKNHSILYGKVFDKEILANVSNMEFIDKNINIFGDIVGLCLFTDSDIKINAFNLIFYLRFIKLFSIPSKNPVILFLKNKKEMESFIINPKLIQLYLNGYINSSKCNLNSICFKKKIEIFEQKSKYVSYKKMVDIELFYQPLAILKE